MLDRTIAPPVQDLQNISLPKATLEELSNGTRVHYLVNNTQDVVRFEIVFKAGKWYETKKGVSYLTSKLIMEGTTGKNAKQLADILDYYGASLEINQGFDFATLTLYTLSRHTQPLLELVSEILTTANFPEPEFELLKTRTIQNLEVERKKPAYLANEIFSKNVFGQDHPYASGLTDEEIKAVNLEEIRTFYKNFYSVINAEVFVCGAITGEHKKLIRHLFGGNALKASYLTEPTHALVSGTQKEALPISGSLQAAIRLGKLFPIINDPEYLPLTVLNKILGGYFGSRLMKNIREDKGLTYGIYSTLSVRKNATLFFIGSDVNTNNSELAISEILKEIEKLRTEEISVEELNTVQKFMTGKFLSEITTVFDQTDRYKHLVLHQLPENYFDQYLHTIKTITPIDLLNLSQKYFSSDFYTAIAG